MSVRPVSQPTFSPASILADTIIRTVELGVTITDAALDGETTVVWCDLRDGVTARCPGSQTTGIYRWSKAARPPRYFTHRASDGPTEAINGRLEALRRNALGFRNLSNYRIRALLHSGHLAL